MQCSLDRLTSTTLVVSVATVLFCCSCSRIQAVNAEVSPKAPEESIATSAPASREIHATGTIQAVQAFSVQVPQISGSVGQQNNGRLTLIRLVPNGTKVEKGELLAEFDRTAQLDAALEAKAKFEDLGHQVREKEAKNNSDAAKRSTAISQAQADLSKAEIQLKKGPVLSTIDRLKNEEKASNAKARLESVLKSDASRKVSEAAALEILRLQMERQRVALERSERNAEALLLKAPLSGMVALESIWRGGSMGNAQNGDQLGSGQPLLKIFSPAEMEVRTLVGEPDGAILREGTIATVYLDAYPDVSFTARFRSASPVATAALGSPIRNFGAVFRIESNDPRLLPDLSAAVVIRPGGRP